MRGRAGNKMAAALVVLFALPALCGCSMAERNKLREPLIIEVISAAALSDPETETVSAAAQVAGKPSVLIYHTHTWEAYEMTEDTQYEPTETWRTKDKRYNMVRIGEALAQNLMALGFDVMHDQTAFEPPNLSGSYVRSLEMLENRLNAGETYDYILDVHRDAYSGLYNGANSISTETGDAAYVMMLVGKGTGATGSGFDERPDWPANLALAQEITDEMNSCVKGISRDVKIKTGRFNQHISSGALLIEVGNNRNTLDEALAACPIIAQAIANVHLNRASD